jgi:hypothetical protein
MCLVQGMVEEPYLDMLVVLLYNVLFRVVITVALTKINHQKR